MFDLIREDLKRFKEDNNRPAWRSFVAGLMSPGLQAILVYRFFNWCFRHRIPTQPIRYFIERFTEITTGVSIPAQCKIGKGLRIHHFGGVILHPSVEIGDYCTLYHEVTIGDRGGSGRAARIGSHVVIGAGAKIIGEINIAENCIIGANSVVTKNMPSNFVAYGNPAVYQPKKESKREGRS